MLKEKLSLKMSHRIYAIAAGISIFLHGLLGLAPSFSQSAMDQSLRSAQSPASVEIVPAKLLSGGDLSDWEAGTTGSPKAPPQRILHQAEENGDSRTESPEPVMTDSQLSPVFHESVAEPLLVAPASGNPAVTETVKPMESSGESGLENRGNPDGQTSKTVSDEMGGIGVAGAGSGEKAVKILRGTAPGYPIAARQAGWEGVVMVRVLVDSRGAAGLVSLRESSGHQLLDDVVLQTVKKWRFAPATKNGKPVAGFHDVRVRFRLTEP